MATLAEDMNNTQLSEVYTREETQRRIRSYGWKGPHGGSACLTALRRGVGFRCPTRLSRFLL